MKRENWLEEINPKAPELLDFSTKTAYKEINDLQGNSDMSEAGKRLIAGATEALAIVRGEAPAARITMYGQHYVPESAIADERERCAAICDRIASEHGKWKDDAISAEAADECAAAIRKGEA